MDRSNHYEAAFEGYLQWHRLPYIGVDESRRSFLGEERVKSLDFIVCGHHGSRWLIDVKGRRFPAGREERPRRIWECWSTREDVISLQRWAERFGPGYQPLLVFMYHLLPYAPPVGVDDEVWNWHGRRYLLRAVPVLDYQRWMRLRSPKWDTVMLSRAAYQQVAKPFREIIRQATASHLLAGRPALPESIAAAKRED
jgi:hypothetical protein